MFKERYHASDWGYIVTYLLAPGYVDWRACLIVTLYNCDSAPARSASTRPLASHDSANTTKTLTMSDIEDEYETQQLATQNKFPWLRVLTSCAINMLIPMVNGLCLGFGEIFAHEICVNFGWRQARVYDPESMAIRQRRSWLWPI